MNGKITLEMHKPGELKNILDFIENNSTKSDFVKWFNMQYKSTLSEKEDWEEIRNEILHDKKIDASELKIYAASVSSKEDVRNVLEKTKEEVHEAKEVVHELSYLSWFKKFSVAVGGAIFFQGFFLLAAGVAILSGVINIYGFEPLQNFLALSLLLIGIPNIIGGLLLMTE